jgi:hypothetical protein
VLREQTAGPCFGSCWLIMRPKVKPMQHAGPTSSLGGITVAIWPARQLEEDPSSSVPLGRPAGPRT